MSNEQNYCGNFCFCYCLGGVVFGEDGGGFLIQNVSYILQFGYEKNFQDFEDLCYGDNLFNYGYIGQFEQEWCFIWDIQFDDLLGVVVIYMDYFQVLIDYILGDVNLVLANYNNVFQDGDVFEILFILQAFNIFNGVMNFVFSSLWNFYINVGMVYNLNCKCDWDIYIFQVCIFFDLVLGGFDKGCYNIQLGVWYEEWINCEWFINLCFLWFFFCQLVNSYIQGILFGEDNCLFSDILDVVFVFDLQIGVLIINLFIGEQFMGVIYDVVIILGDEVQFYECVCNVIGDGFKDFVNIDVFFFDQLSLDMFLVWELNDFVVGGLFILSYFGYDYFGNIFNGLFEDFFIMCDFLIGLCIFLVVFFCLIYGVVYIQDKFIFKDIIFCLGVWVD